MIPRLHRFYGGDPNSWPRVPLRWLRAYLVMLPRLQAEESMNTVTATAIGTGSAQRSDRERIMAGWQRQTQPEGRRSRVTIGQRALVLATMGIVTVIVKKEPEPKAHLELHTD